MTSSDSDTSRLRLSLRASVIADIPAAIPAPPPPPPAAPFADPETSGVDVWMGVYEGIPSLPTAFCGAWMRLIIGPPG